MNRCVSALVLIHAPCGVQSMDQRSILQNWLKDHREKDVTLIIAGRVFGGRLGESPQRPKAFELVGDALVVRFATTERLTITGFKGISRNEQGALVVSEAEDVRFEWHYYGRPQVPANRCEEIYRKQGDIVRVVHLGPLLSGTETFPYTEEDLVVLL